MSVVDTPANPPPKTSLRSSLFWRLFGYKLLNSVQNPRGIVKLTILLVDH
jgi:hypothetical protein